MLQLEIGQECIGISIDTNVFSLFSNMKQQLITDKVLRILATPEAKTAKISNFWTFCTVILLIFHVSKFTSMDSGAKRCAPTC